jgi:hypothetical protein
MNRGGLHIKRNLNSHELLFKSWLCTSNYKKEIVKLNQFQVLAPLLLL